MKSIIFTIAFIGFCGLSVPGEAQIFKKIGKKIEKSVNKRLESRADRTVEKGLDKIESESENAVKDATSSKHQQPTQKKVNLGSGLSADQVESEDYTISMKGSGPDLFVAYQLEVESESAKQSDMNVDVVMEIYASPSQNGSRSEISMNVPLLGEIKTVGIYDFDKPDQVIQMNEKQKKYAIIDLSEAKKSSSEEVFTITKLGEQQLLGLKTIHCKAESNQGQVFEIWTCKNLPGYQQMMAIYGKNQQMGSDNLYESLAKAGCDGFLVKLKMQTPKHTSVMRMTQLQKTEVTEEMLQVPSDYKLSRQAIGNPYL